VELHGHIELAEGKIDAGLKTLAQASHKERRLCYTEPPYYPRPVAEYLGGAALRHGRTPAAQTAFREALEQYPASARAVAGLKEASRRDGKTAVTGF
jgi:predicted negative regulator of RcsB-dependent stress response